MVHTSEIPDFLLQERANHFGMEIIKRLNAEHVKESIQKDYRRHSER